MAGGLLDPCELWIAHSESAALAIEPNCVNCLRLDPPRGQSCVEFRLRWVRVAGDIPPRPPLPGGDRAVQPSIPNPSPGTAEATTVEVT